VALYQLKAAVLANSPVAYWPMQEASGFFQDFSGNGHHCTTSTFAGSQLGQPGPGSNDILSVSGLSVSQTCPVVSTAVSNISFETWFCIDARPSTDQGLCNTGVGLTGFTLLTGANGNTLTNRSVCQGVAFMSNFSQNFTIGTWYHCVVVRAAAVWSYYINGLVDTANAGSTGPNAPAVTTAIGGSQGNTVRQTNVAMYNTVLSVADALKHYQAGLAAVDAIIDMPTKRRESRGVSWG